MVNNLKIENVYCMHENFVDTIFGNDSKIDRQPWIDHVAIEVPWILKPETMVLYAYELLHRPENKDKVFDPPDYKVAKRWMTILH